MRRTVGRRAGVVAVSMLASLIATIGSAGGAVAATAKTQNEPGSTWVQPGTGSLDGLGTFVYVAAPTPGANQASPLGYEYTLGFKFDDNSLGVLAIGYKDGHKVAGFGLIPSHLVDTVAFDWNFGHIYYLLT